RPGPGPGPVPGPARGRADADLHLLHGDDAPAPPAGRPLRPGPLRRGGGRMSRLPSDPAQDVRTPLPADVAALAEVPADKGEVHLVHLYPREMSIYGDLGNTRCLAARLRWHGYRPV